MINVKLGRYYARADKIPVHIVTQYADEQYAFEDCNGERYDRRGSHSDNWESRLLYELRKAEDV